MTSPVKGRISFLAFFVVVVLGALNSLALATHDSSCSNNETCSEPEDNEDYFITYSLIPTPKLYDCCSKWRKKFKSHDFLNKCLDGYYGPGCERANNDVSVPFRHTIFESRILSEYGASYFNPISRRVQTGLAQEMRINLSNIHLQDGVPFLRISGIEQSGNYSAFATSQESRSILLETLFQVKKYLSIEADDTALIIWSAQLSLRLGDFDAYYGILLHISQ